MVRLAHREHQNDGQVNVMKKLQIEFKLQFMTTHDEDAKVFVGYIPALRMYTQASTVERLDAALKSLVCSFVTLCHERGLLDEAMQSRGLSRNEKPTTIESVKNSDDYQYITVGQVQREVYEDIPSVLLAGKQGVLECRH